MPETLVRVGPHQWSILFALASIWPRPVSTDAIHKVVLPFQRPARVKEILESLRRRGLVTYVCQGRPGGRRRVEGWQITATGNLARARLRAAQAAQLPH